MTARAHEKKKPGLTHARDRGRVLLIADKPSAAYVQAIESIGFEILDVSSGTAALVALHKSRPHVVIVNPDVHGVRANELVKMLGKMQDGLPLLLTGTEPATIERRRAALAAGAFDYFEMPAELGLLIERTKQLVELKQIMDRLRAEANFDHLTGLANRRRFRLALSREVERWRRYGVPCALLLLDIDHLKAINDKHGHIAGDMAIRHVGHLLAAVSRENDTAARLGGEEFALLLAGIPEGKAVSAAERLRSALAEQSVEGIGQVTVSIGVAACPTHADSERSLYAASDQALYDAKNEGRNRVGVAPVKAREGRG